MIMELDDDKKIMNLMGCSMRDKGKEMSKYGEKRDQERERAKINS